MNKRLTFILFAMAVAIQVAVLVLVPSRQIKARVEGRSIFLHVRPVDPYNILSGYHAILGYDIGSREAFKNSIPLKGGQDFYAIVERQPDGFWTPLSLAKEQPRELPPNRIAIRGRQENDRLIYGIEEYFIPEARRDEITEMLRTPRQVRVEVKVGSDGQAALIGLSRAPAAAGGDERSALLAQVQKVNAEVDGLIKSGKAAEALDRMLAIRKKAARLAQSGGPISVIDMEPEMRKMRSRIVQAACGCERYDAIKEEDFVAIRTMGAAQQQQIIDGMRKSDKPIERWISYLADPVLTNQTPQANAGFFRLALADPDPVIRYKALNRFHQSNMWLVLSFGAIPAGGMSQEEYRTLLEKVVREDTDAMNKAIAGTLLGWMKEPESPANGPVPLFPLMERATTGLDWLMDGSFEPGFGPMSGNIVYPGGMPGGRQRFGP